MSEEKLKNYWGKNIKITCIDGDIVQGFAKYFTPAIDNEPEIASISVKTDLMLVEVMLDEIKEIEIIQ